MATWQELSTDSLHAARKLAREGHYRSSVSRAYYAAYSAATSRIAATRVGFARGRDNPAHEQLAKLIVHNLRLPRAKRQRLVKLVRLLRHTREAADYKPYYPIDRKTAVASIRHALLALEILEVSYED